MSIIKPEGTKIVELDDLFKEYNQKLKDKFDSIFRFAHKMAMSKNAYETDKDGTVVMHARYALATDIVEDDLTQKADLLINGFLSELKTHISPGRFFLIRKFPELVPYENRIMATCRLGLIPENYTEEMFNDFINYIEKGN